MAEAPRNGTVDTVNKLLRGIVDAARTAAKAALVSTAPFFGLPVVSQIVDYLIGRISDELFKQLSVQSSFIIVDIQTAQKLYSYVEELERLKKAQESEDPSDDKEALERARNSLGKLIRFSS